MVVNREVGQLVMRDCISLEMACEKFWIFSRRSILENGTLSEGVIAEKFARTCSRIDSTGWPDPSTS